MNVSQPAIRLRELRNSVSISIREMAAELGMAKSKYEHYETRYKKPYLPADFAEAVANVLARRGVPREDVLRLASPSDPPGTPDDLNLGPRYSRLSPRRQRMLRDLLEELEAAEAAYQAHHTRFDDTPDKAEPHD